MGVGLDTGVAIDALAENLATELDRADLAALQGDLDSLKSAMIVLASNLLVIPPFAPANGLPEGWENILAQWLSGAPISEISEEGVSVIEDAFVYRLVWAIEVVRTRRVAHGLLPSFLDSNTLKVWLNSEEVVAASARPDWPTAETHSLWCRFKDEFLSDRDSSWETERIVVEGDFNPRVADNLFRIELSSDGTVQVYTPDYRPIGIQINRMDPLRSKNTYGRLGEMGGLEIYRVGPRI